MAASEKCGLREGLWRPSVGSEPCAVILALLVFWLFLSGMEGLHSTLAAAALPLHRLFWRFPSVLDRHYILYGWLIFCSLYCVFQDLTDSQTKVNIDCLTWHLRWGAKMYQFILTYEKPDCILHNFTKSTLSVWAMCLLDQLYFIYEIPCRLIRPGKHSKP